MREVVSILLPGAEDTIEVEVDYIHHDAFMAGAKDGGELAPPPPAGEWETPPITSTAR